MVKKLLLGLNPSMADVCGAPIVSLIKTLTSGCTKETEPVISDMYCKSTWIEAPTIWID